MFTVCPQRVDSIWNEQLLSIWEDYVVTEKSNRFESARTRLWKLNFSYLYVRLVLMKFFMMCLLPVWELCADFVIVT